MDMPDIPDSRPKVNGFRPGYSRSATPTTPTIQIDDQGYEIDPSSYGETQSLRSQPSLWSLRQNGVHHHHHHHHHQSNGSTINGSTSTNDLPILQELNPLEESEEYDPVNEDSFSYDLVAPYEGDAAPRHSLERQADLMFSAKHMLTILTTPRYLAHFREFLAEERPKSLAMLTYYLNANKALKAIQYANALVRLSIDVPTPGIRNRSQPIGVTENTALETRVQEALIALTAEELPAFIAATCVNITSKVVKARVRGTLPDKFGGTADALAEVFCLTDPSRPDNPIIFASEEFHRTTQYGMDYVLGRNCRFLQGPNSNPNSVRRIREALTACRHHSELFVNYRRDGSPFMNLLQCAPLCDSNGRVRYFIGAQIDVSGLAMEGVEMESLQTLIQEQQRQQQQQQQQQHQEVRPGSTAPEEGEKPMEPAQPESKSEFQELGELLSPREMRILHEHGGNLFQPVVNSSAARTWLLPESGNQPDVEVQSRTSKAPPLSNTIRRSLTGVYKNFLLVRPYPSLRILFTSPSFQIPGILQSSFFARIGPSAEREGLYEAMMIGRSVTARIKWVTRYNVEGRNRWVHCTPLLAKNGQVGVWMVVVVDEVDDEEDEGEAKVVPVKSP